MHLRIDPTGSPQSGVLDFGDDFTVIATDWTQAKHEMMTGAVTYLELPYWLGSCPECKKIGAKYCTHMGTGLDFFKWMDKADFWIPMGSFFVTNGEGVEINELYDFHRDREARMGTAA